MNLPSARPARLQLRVSANWNQLEIKKLSTSKAGLITLLVAGMLSAAGVCAQSTPAFGGDSATAVINSKGVMVGSDPLIIEEYPLVSAKIARPSMSREFKEKYFNKNMVWF